MKPFRDDFNFFVRPQEDGTFAVISQDKRSKKLDIVSTHDTLEEAEREKVVLKLPASPKPSQADTMKQMNLMGNAVEDLRNNKL